MTTGSAPQRGEGIYASRSQRRRAVAAQMSPDLRSAATVGLPAMVLRRMLGHQVGA